MTFVPKFETLPAIWATSLRHYGDRPLFGVRQRGTWGWTTYAEIGRKVDRCADALRAAGVQRGDRVAIISKNRPEWAVTAYATYGIGAIFVPLHPVQTVAEQRYILRDCGAKLVIAEGEDLATRLLYPPKEAGDELDRLSLERVVVIDGTDRGEHPSFEGFLRRKPEEPLPEHVPPSPEDVATIMYTSGTTGLPKGVRLTHRNIASNISAIHQLFLIEPDDRSVAFLPWAHIFGQTVELHALISMGASMGLADDPETIGEYFLEVEPTLVFAVPQVFNRMYDAVHRRFEEEGGLSLSLFERAMSNARLRKRLAARRITRGRAELRHVIYERLVFRRIRARFGGRLRYAFSGGAALSREVAEFVDNLGVMVYEGYGLTETSPIVACNFPGNRKIGTVGKVIPGAHIAIDTEVTDDKKHGEILVFGHGVMQGYHGDGVRDAEVFVERDGERGVRTGDLGFLDGQGFLHLSGRVKEQYKLLNGRYVVPTPLEDVLRLSPYIVDAMIYGDNRAHNVAVIIPEFSTVIPWAAERGIAGDRATLVQNPAVRDLMRGEIDRFGQSFRPYERVKDFVLGTVPFSVEGGTLTATGKVRRSKVLARYRAPVEALYREAG